MERFKINGGNKLEGTLDVYSAKNSVLALLAASILTENQVVIHKCPLITDVFNMIKILENLGSKVSWQGDSLVLDNASANCFEIPSSYAKEIRSSIFMLGSILGRFGQAKAVFPGGCEIGLRPIDLHLKGFRALNIKVNDHGGYIECDARDAKGSNIHLDFPSVGATENIILAAVKAKGKTIISNAAKEPEILALQHFLNKMGAKVSGAGTSTIEVNGVKQLTSVEFTPIPDRIVAGTYMIAAAITNGDLLITNCNPTHVRSLISKMNGCLCDIKVLGKNIRVKGYAYPKATESVETSPYPGFPTDLQAQMLALATIAKGTTMIVENIFEMRYKHIVELKKMGADITVRDRLAIVRGVDRLSGAEVSACDLRGGAALVLAGLNAKDSTTVTNVKFIDRGYYQFDKELRKVGADIVRILE